MVVCPSYVRTKFQENVLVGRPPDEQASGKRFATTAPDLAWANADGILRERRTLVYPASGWALIMGRGMLAGRPPDELSSGKRFATTAPDLAWANADGIVRERRILVYPASGWALIMRRGMLVGRPPDEQASGKRFATNAPDLAWANADGIVRERRTLVYPALRWALIMGRGMLVGRWLDKQARGKRFAVMAWQYWPQVVEAFFLKFQRDHR